MSAGAAFAGVQIAGALQGGMSDNSAARAEARGHDENARLTLLAGEQQATVTRHDERDAAGALIADMAGSGIAMGSGTALDLIRESALQREIEIGNIRAQAQGEARNHLQAGADARYAGKQALIGGIFNAAGAAVGYAASSSGQQRIAAIGARERATFGGRRPYSTGYRPRLRVLGPPSD